MTNKHGGKRKGAGRKPKYGEETQTISFRVPLALINPILNTSNARWQKVKNKLYITVCGFVQCRQTCTKLSKK